VLLPSPDKVPGQQQSSRNRPTGLLDVVQQVVELIRESVPKERNRCDPGCRSQQVELKKPFPLHVQTPGHGPRDGSQAENETREEDGPAPMRRNEVSGGPDIFIVHAQHLLCPADERLAKVPPYPVPEIVAHDGSNNPNRDDKLNSETRFLMTQKAGEHKKRFAGQRESHALSKDSQQKRPVPPRAEHLSNRVIDPMHPGLDACA
jgi:hypothetical protein